MGVQVWLASFHCMTFYDILSPKRSRNHVITDDYLVTRSFNLTPFLRIALPNTKIGAGELLALPVNKIMVDIRHAAELPLFNPQYRISEKLLAVS